MDKPFPHSLRCLAEVLRTDHANMLRYLREYFTSGIDYITVTHGSDPGNERRKLTFWLSDSCCRHMVTLGEGLPDKPHRFMARAGSTLPSMFVRGTLVEN